MTDNSNEAPELLSCPFCGGKANAGWFAITHNIGCDECGYSLDACKSDIGLSYEDSFTPEVEAAIAKFNVTRWNTRADLASAQIAAAYEAAASAIVSRNDPPDPEDGYSLYQGDRPYICEESAYRRIRALAQEDGE